MSAVAAKGSPSRAWYREPWPWFLLAIPGAAVLMGAVMIVLAVRTNDGLVAEDYYKQGLAINQVLDREARARELGIVAAVPAASDRSRVFVRFAAPEGAVKAPVLTLVHPTRAGQDQRVLLERTPAGEYEGTLAPLAPGHWRLVVEDRDAGWRLQGAWQTDSGIVELRPLK
jgi:hypothetical protein